MSSRFYSSIPTCDAGFSIEGPSQAKIDCNDNGDGSANVSYWPTVPGEYAVHVLCNEEDIPNSPYMANITPKIGDFNPANVSDVLSRSGLVKVIMYCLIIYFYFLTLFVAYLLT